jgi:hypothetical protein
MPPDTDTLPAGLVRDAGAPNLYGDAPWQVRDADDSHRYLLGRRWAPDGPVAVWVMLNPSTANQEEDDATIGRCATFSRREGCGSLVVVNLFAARATDPRELTRHPDPVGAHNDEVISGECLPGRLVIVAWGTHGRLNGRAGEVARLLAGRNVTLWCLGTNTDGSPGHPLYLLASTPLQAWPAAMPAHPGGEPHGR